ncbi:HepT-like ribonuclease domain-containing protein [Thermovibrio sp.]
MKPKESKVYLSLLETHHSGVRLFKLEQRGFEAFVNDSILQRSLEAIREAVKNLPKEFRDKHPQIPWKRIAGMRDVLIHE